MAASLADGLVQRCEEAFSDASFQEATATLQTVAELDPQSITLGLLQDRLSKVLIVEVDKGLQAKDIKQIALLLPLLRSFDAPLEAQTNAGNGLKSCFKWAADSDLIPALPKFGPDFQKSSGGVTRRHQQQRQAERGGKLDFSSAEIQKLLKASDGWLHRSNLATHLAKVDVSFPTGSRT